MPISYVLKNGDQVDIISSSNQKAKTDWLEFVVTSRAKSKIKNALNASKNNMVDEGKEILMRKLRHLKINFNEEEINKMQKFFHLKTSQDLFLNVYNGKIDSSQIKKYAESKGILNNFLNKFRRTAPPKKEYENAQENFENLDMIVFGQDEQKMDYSFAKCCQVMAGDSIFGFISINEGIKVHHDACPNAINLRAQFDYRIIPAKWVNAEKFKNQAKIEIVALDRMGILNDVTNIISGSYELDIKNMNFHSDNGIFKGIVTFEVSNKKQLEVVIKKITEIPNVSMVKRINF